MQNNIKIILAYDGANYFGWQRTLTGPSIQETLEKSLSLILREPIHVNGASRTDRGVHARGQTLNFLTHSPFTSKTLWNLNKVLPPDIMAASFDLVPLDFHATLSVSSKIYRYHLTNASYQLPQNRFTEWHHPYTLNYELMKQACSLLTGTHDFEALTNQKNNETYDNHIRTLKRFGVDQNDRQFTFTIEGDNFLYKMVRNLIGLVVYVGQGKIPLEDIPEILNSKDRKKAGVTAPAHGLFLEKVNY